MVHDAQGLDDARMAAFARWTNLSETTFVLPPTDAAADYRVRIFTPGGELPFAGHPTLGSCHAWLAAGGRPREPAWWCSNAASAWSRCGATATRLAFAAPPLRRSGPLDAALLQQIRAALGLERRRDPRPPVGGQRPRLVCGAAAIRPKRVLALRPDWPALGDLKLGVVGPHRAGAETQFELRAFIGGGNYEDPVTGSLNASVAQWLIGARLAPPRYVAAQGAALQRAGRVHIDSDGDTVWVGGDVSACIRGEVEL